MFFLRKFIIVPVFYSLTCVFRRLRESKNRFMLGPLWRWGSANMGSICLALGEKASCVESNCDLMTFPLKSNAKRDSLSHMSGLRQFTNQCGTFFRMSALGRLGFPLASLSPAPGLALMTIARLSIKLSLLWLQAPPFQGALT